MKLFGHVRINETLDLAKKSEQKQGYFNETRDCSPVPCAPRAKFRGHNEAAGNANGQLCGVGAVTHMQDTHVHVCLIVFLLLKTITKVSIPGCPLSAMVTERMLNMIALLSWSQLKKQGVFFQCISGVSFNFNNILLYIGRC